MGIRVLPFIVGSLIGFTSMTPAFALSKQEMESQIYLVGANESSKTVTLGGSVVAHKTVILTAQIPGRVLRVYGKEGDSFKQGALLLELTEDALRAKLNAAVAQRDAATAQIQAAKVHYQAQVRGDNQNPMLKNTPMSWMGNMVPKKRGDSFNADVHGARTNVQQAESAYAMANAQIIAINSKFRDAKTVAPMAGTIMKKMVEEGDTIQPGMKLLEFADTKILQVNVEIPAQQIDGVHEGMFVDVKIDNRISTQARVARRHPIASAQHTFTVELGLPADLSQSVSPGMYAEVYVSDITKSVRALPVVPKSAMRLDRSTPQVYVLRNNVPVLRAIRIEKTPISGDNYLVLSGLKVGDRILKTANQKLVREWLKSMR